MPEATIAPAEVDRDFGGSSSSSGGLGSWVKEHKAAAAGIGTIILGGAFLWYRKKKTAASQGPNAGGIGTTTGPGVYEIAPGSLGTSSGAYGSSLNNGGAGPYPGLMQTPQDTPASIAPSGAYPPASVSQAAPGAGAYTAGSVNNNASNATSQFDAWIKTPGAAAYYDEQVGNLAYLPGGVETQYANHPTAFSKWITSKGASQYYQYKTGSGQYSFLNH